MAGKFIIFCSWHQNTFERKKKEPVSVGKSIGVLGVEAACLEPEHWPPPGLKNLNTPVHWRGENFVTLGLLFVGGGSVGWDLLCDKGFPGNLLVHSSQSVNVSLRA